MCQGHAGQLGRLWGLPGLGVWVRRGQQGSRFQFSYIVEFYVKKFKNKKPRGAAWLHRGAGQAVGVLWFPVLAPAVSCSWLGGGWGRKPPAPHRWEQLTVTWASSAAAPPPSHPLGEAARSHRFPASAAALLCRGPCLVQVWGAALLRAALGRAASSVSLTPSGGRENRGPDPLLLWQWASGPRSPCWLPSSALACSLSHTEWLLRRQPPGDME